MIWVQGKHTTGDQSFESAVLVGKDLREEVMKSHRSPDRDDGNNSNNHNSKFPLEVKTFLVVFFGFLGFIVQFQGFRLSNWSCSVAQLVATMLTTMIRAIVRRDVTKTPRDIRAPEGYELDYLTLSIVGLGGGFAGDPKFSDTPELSFEFTDGIAMGLNGSKLEFERKVDLDSLSKSNSESESKSGSNPHAQAEVNTQEVPKPDSQAQRAMELRARLARITRWKGPKFEEAVILANSIEAALNVLKPTLEEPASVWIDVYTNNNQQYSEKHLQKVAFTLAKTSTERGEPEWKVNTEEIEAALSLAAFCIHSAKEHGLRSDEVLEQKSDWLRTSDTGEVYSRVLGGSDLLGTLLWWTDNERASYELSTFIGHSKFSGTEKPRLGFRIGETKSLGKFHIL